VAEPRQLPIGLQLTRTARALHADFDRRMTAAGGSATTWQVLVLVRAQKGQPQTVLARAMGITGATLTHHLQGLEARGLVSRRRGDENRRVQHVELTDAGDALFGRLAQVARSFDAQLRSRLGEERAALLAELLGDVAAGLDAAPAVAAEPQQPAAASARFRYPRAEPPP
jgi:MarR family transcriptional regulator for hemolysin